MVYRLIKWNQIQGFNLSKKIAWRIYIYCFSFSWSKTIQKARIDILYVVKRKKNSKLQNQEQIDRNCKTKKKSDSQRITFNHVGFWENDPQRLDSWKSVFKKNKMGHNFLEKSSFKGGRFSEKQPSVNSLLGLLRN